jgi:chromosome segregation ATPase
MSSFLLVSLYEFKQFLQIVLWIALPLTLLAVLLTTILHYRRKKKKSGAEAAYPDDIGFHTVLPATGQQAPDWLTSGAQPDNMSLIKKYEQEVRRSRENYAVLEDDFRSLEKKYSDLLNRAYSTEKQEDDYVNTLKQEVEDYKQEIGRLKEQVTVLNESIPEQDNLESIPRLQATIQQLQEALREQQEKKESLASEISKLENLLKNMEFSANGARSESADLQHYFSQQLDDLGKKHQVEKDELKTQLDQSQTTLNQLQEEKTELKSRFNELQYSWSNVLKAITR